MEKHVIYLIIFGMLSTGTLNTLLNKFQDLQCVAGSTLESPQTCQHYFEQPLLQTLNMFVGEIMCLFLFMGQEYWGRMRRRSEATSGGGGSASPSGGGREEGAGEQDPLLAGQQDEVVDNGAGLERDDTSMTTDAPLAKPLLAGWSQLLFLLPTLCDLTATTLMNVGLLFVSASVYQMLRGSVVLFTGCFSTLFLGIRHAKYRWVALLIVFFGVGIVGVSSLFKPVARGDDATNATTMPATNADHYATNITTTTNTMTNTMTATTTNTNTMTATTTPSNPWIGVCMIILAQCFTATQFVVEEKIMHVYRVPAVKAVGLEGLFGLVLTVAAVPIMHYTVGVSRPPGPGNPFDMFESFRELLMPNIFYAAIGICFSISLFNWCGLAVTQSISATSRSTIDTCRTLFIWMFSLAFGWESFSLLQVAGFLVLIYGTFLFNDVVPPPHFLVDEREIQLVEDVLIVPAGNYNATTASSNPSPVSPES